MAKKVKLDSVGWCVKCLRPFDRPKPSDHPGAGWKVCDECMVNTKRGTKPRRDQRTARNLAQPKGVQG